METINKAMQIGYQKASERDHNPSNRKIVEYFWTEMARLFPNMWLNREGDIFTGHGNYTENFLDWCQDLSGVTSEQYKGAFRLMVERSAQAALDGKEYWPPSYGGFKGLCRVKKAHQEFKRQLPYNRQERNRIGKQETSKLYELMNGARYMPVEERDRILAQAQEDSLKELFS